MAEVLRESARGVMYVAMGALAKCCGNHERSIDLGEEAEKVTNHMADTAG